MAGKSEGMGHQKIICGVDDPSVGLSIKKHPQEKKPRIRILVLNKDPVHPRNIEDLLEEFKFIKVSGADNLELDELHSQQHTVVIYIHYKNNKTTFFEHFITKFYRTYLTKSPFTQVMWSAKLI